MTNASLFVDDAGAWDQYEREESENNEPEVSPIVLYRHVPDLIFVPLYVIISEYSEPFL